MIRMVLHYCAQILMYYKKGTVNEISDTLSINPLVNCDINSLMNGIIDLTKGRFCHNINE